MALTRMADTLTGFVERVTFHNPENGFAVFRVKVKERKDFVTVVGTIRVTCVGTWVATSQGTFFVMV